jgi:hypothetical protein
LYTSVKAVDGDCDEISTSSSGGSQMLKRDA